MRPYAVLALLLLSACGASGARPVTPASSDELQPLAFLFDVASASIEVLTPPERSIEDLTAARGDAHGGERRAILRDLARAHLVAARNTEGREARRHRESVERFTENASEGSRDDTLTAEMDFLEVWMAWESDARNASARAERFTNRHETAGEMLLVVWMIRGELAITAEDWTAARDAFRFALGRLDHVLYAYALYRTAYAWHRAGDDVEARQALTEVVALGCESGEPRTMRIALLAAGQLGVGTRRDPDGPVRPATCPEAGAHTEDEEEGWRPPE